jgi:carboxypeptidase T
VTFDYRQKRPFHYHLLEDASDPRFQGQPAFASISQEVPPNTRRGRPERKEFYGLRRDLAELRRIGAQNGIVDTSVVSLGTSGERRDILAIKIGKGTQHKILFTGCHHAREWISLELPYLIAEYLILNYTPTPSNAKQRRIKHLVDNRLMWFVPLVNPDGHRHTIQSDRRWRPNRRRVEWTQAETITASRLGSSDKSTYNIPAGFVARGIDINRNYPETNWGVETFLHGVVKTSADPGEAGRDSIWCGPSKGSEAETKVIDALFRRERFRASITYHNFGLVLVHPDTQERPTYLHDVGKGMTQLLSSYGATYTYGAVDQPYPTTGDLLVHSSQLQPGRPSFLPEVRPADGGPEAEEFSGLPETEIEDCFKENLAAGLALINSAGFDQSTTTISVPLRGGPRQVQVVRPVWQVFQGWQP